MVSEHGQARREDPQTSKDAAALVRPGSARARLLEAHARFPTGLTDEEAAIQADLELTSEYATRCSELLRAGLLEDTPMTRTGNAGMARMVRRITFLGRSTISGAAPVPSVPPPVDPNRVPCPVASCSRDLYAVVISWGYAQGRCQKHGKQTAKV
jgi:hypothetical protein